MWKLLALLWFLITLFIAAFVAFFGLVGVSQTVVVPPIEDYFPLTVMDRIESEPELSTAAVAIEAAGLQDTLRGAGDFTLFLPNNAAFKVLPEGVLDALLTDIPTLTDILLYHAALGQYRAEDVLLLEKLSMINGQEVSIEATDEGVFVNQARIIVTDLEASNGMIHIIDAVLIPTGE